jgi:cytochrome c oxidase cbb3-type subunit 1
MTMNKETSPNDRASWAPLVLLMLSGIIWLVVASVLGLISSIQAYSPRFMAECPVFTYGRVSAAAQTAFVYGWIANAGLGLTLWVMGRLAGEPLRAQGWALVGGGFWNLSVLAAVGGILMGDATGFDLLGLPGYTHLALFLSYGAVAVGGLLAWGGRLRRVSFASHWYAAAALFSFPWLLSLAHVVLFSAPLHGVLQPIAAGWYAQSALSLWIAPLALAVAYYVVPKLTGKVLPSYEFASLGFWCLVFVGGLTGGRHLLGGPVPAWIPSLAVVSCALLLFHTLIVFLNLRGAIFGGGTTLSFVGFGILAYVLGALVDAMTSLHVVAVQTQFTYFEDAQRQLALYGAVSTLLFGGIYFALPRITGKAWLSGSLVKAHLFLAVVGILLLVVSLAVAGLDQGRGLLDPSAGFPAITAAARPALAAAVVAQVLLLAASIIFLANLYGTACMILNLSVPAWLNPAMEEHAS